MYQTENRENRHYTQKSLDYENILSFVDENVKTKNVEIQTDEKHDNQ
jgi:hypothetical protein